MRRRCKLFWAEYVLSKRRRVQAVERMRGVM
jgi:hypothetical protein